MWPERLKINKQLATAMADAELNAPKEIQEKSMTKIAGGQDVVAIGPEGCGKTTTYILSIIMKLKYPHEEAPRALILVPDKERGMAVIEKFQELAKNTQLRILGLFSGVGMEPQLDALADGTDVVVGTPDRIRAVYLKLALNMNKIVMFVLDDAELLIKQGFQLPVHEITRSLPKCQHLIFGVVFHDKLKKLVDPYLNYPIVIEVDEVVETEVETYNSFLYQLPNFRTKVNLLSLLLFDKETYRKILVFVNSATTAERIFTSLRQRIGSEVVWYRPSDFEQEGCDSFEEFKQTSGYRIMVVANESEIFEDLTDIPHIIHFELPQEESVFLERIQKSAEPTHHPTFITFSTDDELPMVRKIENSIGKKMIVEKLPELLKIEVVEKDLDLEKKKEETKSEDVAPETGGAFHPKKKSNMKQYNYGYKDKMKMAGKISKRRKS